MYCKGYFDLIYLNKCRFSGGFRNTFKKYFEESIFKGFLGLMPKPDRFAF